MAFSESYHCDVCGNEMSGNSSGNSHDWWLIWEDTFTPTRAEAAQPMLLVTAWETLQAHSSGTKHVCGAACAQTLLNRWMLGE